MYMYLSVSAFSSIQSLLQVFHTIQQQNEISIHHSGRNSLSGQIDRDMEVMKGSEFLVIDTVHLIMANRNMDR
jgi:hypothetical protein